jgi:phage major head subunit gpT-like protein
MSEGQRLAITAAAGEEVREGTIRIEGQICEGQTLGMTERVEEQGQAGEQSAGVSTSGHEVRVTVLRGGASSNGYYYNEGALRAIARLLEAAQAYVDHPRTAADSQVRSVRDIVGFYHSPVVVQGPEEPLGRVDATLHILESAQWVWSMIREACALDHPELIGLSIDIYGVWQPMEAGMEVATDGARGAGGGQSGRQGRRLKEVTSVVALNSCDIVTRPSAGGAFQHILQGETCVNRQNGRAQSEARSEALQAAPGAQVQDEGRVQEQGVAYSTVTGSAGDHERTVSETVRTPRQASEQEGAALLEELRRERGQLLLERRLLEAGRQGLPEAALGLIRGRFAGRVFEEAELEREIDGTRRMLAALSQSGMIRGQGFERPQVGEQITEAEKLQAAFDGMFGLEVNTGRLGNIRPFDSIREAYARVTGDPSVSGASLREPELIRVDEAAPIPRITEADTTTASFSYLLGTSMNKRLLKDYQAWPAEWQRFCTIVPIKDFKQQTRVRLGAFGSLSTVAEDTAYSTITLQDTAATYVPTKRGNLVTVSRETIVNDDLMAIKQIPTKLAVAAAYTLAEFVYAFLSGNPNIYDGSTLFTSGSPHNNLGSANLSSAAMQAGVTAMREQTNMAGKRIGLRPKYLIVPPELEFVAMVATKSAGVPGSANNDINPMLGYVTPIVAPQLSDANKWYFAADPLVIDTIEIGFVGGQVNPALFIQDQPLFGLNFTQDIIS